MYNLETGTIIEHNPAGQIATIATQRGDHLAFGGDQMIVGQFSNLTLGQRVWFSREVVHGPYPMPLQVRDREPAAPRAAKPEAVSEQK